MRSIDAAHSVDRAILAILFVVKLCERVVAAASICWKDYHNLVIILLIPWKGLL